jgi:Calcineurin-like phosphoesterase
VPEGPKVVIVGAGHGPVLVSADVHGHFEDFARLREIFLSSHARGEDPLWVSVGDWVHGPAGEPRALYDYPDRTPELLRGLFALMDAHPGRVLSILGNHEHAHIGGVRTSKFHDDEAAFLESQLNADFISDMKRRFRSWPMMVCLPATGVVLTHGALTGGGVADIERIRYSGQIDSDAFEILRAAMTHYGYSEGADAALLEKLGAPYSVIVHGHDREEDGFSPSGARALLLCTSFGARRETKSYLWLDPRRRYASPGELETAIRRLWG